MPTTNEVVNNTTDNVKDSVTNIGDILWGALSDMLSTMGQALPNIIGAIIILIVGVIIARVLRSIVSRGLKLARLDQVLDNENIAGVLEKVGMRQAVSQFIPMAIYWIVVLTFSLAAADRLGIDSITDTVNSLIAFIPSIISAVVVLLITLFAAGFVSKIVRNAIESSNIAPAAKNMIPTVVYGMIAAFGVITAVNQIGLDISVITDNLTVIIGAAALGLSLAGGLAFGMGGKEHAKKMLDKWMS